MIVEVSGLHKAFGSTKVLDGVDLHVAEGTVTALLGPNGAGKTTTIRVLTTLLRPDLGSVRIAGYDVVREATRVRGVISLTGQYVALDDQQTGRENLVMIGRLMHLGRAAARRRAAGLLERFGLVDAMDRRVKTYSGGMRRRLDLAMGLVSQPRVIFLDEPTTGLDPASRTTMWDAVRDLVSSGTTIVLTTQYLEEADRLADRIVLINQGKVTASGTADALKSQVGGSRLDLRFTGAADLARAAALFGVPHGTDPLVLSVPSDGSAAHLHRVLDDLRLADVPVAEVSAHRPTLDDVFLSLTATGRTAIPA
ncbi:daunorubicin resistance protein DrrA family ABC transporter ATP-binding protein [Sphaerisporangium rufum]|uniref:Daunorubicin resistance protein DrrA family ABC transporter ATP-binding protein n=1 Tax=Sphaerisporangium rufum TaxID=1381558 RepID=A0A919V143_9ACTN|nr:ATP-binding cassette domain-containing protein [Sphaerisporangium rufum]GII77458.1 daunorubicin resistance protein DrrA family ABC transporter ATP-binding protein [Sphaerisporangium rufum]